MTNLSVNLNKIALLRNSRGNDNPNLLEFAKKFIDLGVNGITVHPRQDERHITQKDCIELSELLSDYSHVEFNIEGYPSKNFMKLIKREKLNPHKDLVFMGEEIVRYTLQQDRYTQDGLLILQRDSWLVSI